MIPLLLVGGINLLLGFLVFLRSKRNHSHVLFFLTCIFLFLWSSAIALVSGNFSAAVSLPAARMVFAFALPIPYLTLLFSKSFPNKKIKYGWPVLALFALPALILLYILLADDQLISVTSVGGDILLRFGPFNDVFLLYILAYFLMACISFSKNYLEATSVEKLKYKYFFAGILLTTVSVLCSNLILVHFFGRTSSIYFGPLGTFFLVAFSAYAILKYRLMDISVIVKKTTAYSIITSGIIFAYVFIVLVFEFLSRSLWGYSSLWTAVPAALVIAVTFVPLREQLQQVTDRLFFRRTLEYQEAIREVTRMIASVTNLRTLFRLIDQTIVRIMCIKSAAILLLEEKANLYSVEKTNGLPETVMGITFPLADPLINYLMEKKDVVVLDEVRTLLASDLPTPEEKSKLSAVAAGLEKLGAAVAVPSFAKGKLVGILTLGEKLSGEPYGPDDLELLFTMASEAGIAIDNAKMYRDITETKDYLNSLIQGSDDAVITIDLTGKVLSWNEGAAKIFGYSSAETIGQRPPFFSEDEASDYIRRVLGGAAVKTGEIVKKNKAGADLPLLLTCSPIRDAENAIVGVSCIIKDITELKKVDELQHEFLSIISHELRTPLTPIKGYLALFLGGQMGALNEKQLAALSVIMKQSNHLQDLIDTVLDLSRIEAGKPLTLEKEPLFLNQIVKESVESAATAFEEKKIKTNVTYSPDTLAIMGDRKKLVRVIDNILGNALKFTPSGGHVQISVADGNKQMNVTIADSGIGLEDKYLARVFERFFQVDSSSTRASGGIGMGLAIAKEIIEMHGGRIWAESDGLGRGTRIVFSLPVV